METSAVANIAEVCSEQSALICMSPQTLGNSLLASATTKRCNASSGDSYSAQVELKKEAA
eukprot:12110567-Karenia_brevis.AAC.1